jgi:subtilisin family serine protease
MALTSTKPRLHATITITVAIARYPDGVGSQADVWVVDTGVRVTHTDFEGRATFEYNAAGGKSDDDDDGHGTFVAGVVAGKKYGVCKACSVRSVKVFTDSGDCSASILIAAFDWIAKHYNSTRVNVINISVGGDPGETSNALDAAVNAAVDLGIHVIGAAGNENVDACTESPGRAEKIVAVSPRATCKMHMQHTACSMARGCLSHGAAVAARNRSARPCCWPKARTTSSAAPTLAAASSCLHQVLRPLRWEPR